MQNKLKIIKDTVAKYSSKLQGVEIDDPIYKFNVEKNTELDINWSIYIPEDNHYLVELKEPINSRYNWYFFAEHAEINRDVIGGDTNVIPILMGDNLTKNFTLSELVVSQTASRRGLDNSPNELVKKNLKLLAEKVLQPVRDNFNKPVVISSGYRSLAVNRAVGGSSKSQHMTGQAADFIIPGIDNYEVANWIKNNLKYDQLILEFYQGGNSGWVHVGYSTAHKMQNLTINRFGTFSGLKKY